MSKISHSKTALKWQGKQWECLGGHFKGGEKVMGEDKEEIDIG